MIMEPFASAPTSASMASLFAASERLREVISTAPAIEPWFAEVRGAIEGCTRAVEYHLETLDGGGGLKEDVSLREPRLLSRLEHLDAELQQLLPALQDISQTASCPSLGVVGPLARLALELRQVADEEVDLLYESLTPTGSGD